jgi:enoyl-CoA hydratase/carnithine racemase
MRELTIESPGKNALSTAVMEALRARLEEAGGEPLLLTGAGDVFSAGLDLKEVAAIAGPEDTRRLIGALERLVEALFLYPGPTVALVNGHAIAGGCVLALCCDRRVMTAKPGARMGLNEVALGLAFPPRTLAMIRAQLAAPLAERVMLGAELYDANAARVLGLIDEVADDGRAAAVARLEALARLPRDAYARAKAALRGEALRLSRDDERRFEEETLPLWSSAAPAAARRALGR